MSLTEPTVAVDGLRIVLRDTEIDIVDEVSFSIAPGEVLPNTLSPLLVEANLRLTYSIGLIAGLAFLGFSPNPNGADWGFMIQENRLALVSQPWGVVLPVVAITLLTIGTSLVGDGVARAAIGIDRGRAAE